MSNKLILKISKTEIKEFSIDLDDWYSYQKMTPKEKYTLIQEILNDYGDIYEDGGIKLIDCEEDWDLMNWELE